MFGYAINNDGSNWRPLEKIEIPIPKIGSSQLLVRVASIGINRADIFARQGLYLPPKTLPEIPGLEVAGEVVESNIAMYRIGDRVSGITEGGGYAEYAVLDERNILPVYDASLPEALYTCWHNMFNLCGLREGESFLVHGGASGIGVVAIQLGKLMGAKVCATAGTREKVELCRLLGADIVINHREESFSEILKDGVDVILDMVGGDYFSMNLRVLKNNGRLAVISFIGGAKTEVNFAPLLTKNLSIFGSTLRGVGIETRKQIQQELQPFLSRIKPVVDRTFPVSQIEEAHEYVKNYRNLGKVLLKVDAS